MNEITPQNMHNFCRTCLKKPKEKFNIWESEIYDMLVVLCSCELIEKDDKLPDFVCSKCHKKLKSFLEFRVKLLNSLTTLTNIASKPYYGEDQIAMDSNAERVKPLENCDGEVETTLSQSINKEVKSDYETIFCGDIEPKVEVETEIIDIHPPYSAANSPNPADDKEQLDYLEMDLEFQTTQNENDKMQNLSIKTIIDSPNFQDDTDLDEAPEEVTNERTGTSSSKKLPLENVKQAPAQQKGHKKSSGDGGPKLQCDQCPRRFVTKVNYEAHLRTHQGLKPFLCKECGHSFSRGDHWREHVREMHATGKQPIKCTVEGCDKVFQRESSYRAHYRTKHKPAIRLREPKHWVCEDCGNTYNNVTTFTEHRWKHKPIEEYPFNCDECGKKFRSKRRQKEHQYRHTGIKNFVCPHCGMKKATKNELRTHINYHTKERQWPCTKCTSVFNSSANLGMHDRVVHKGIRRFACKYCDQSFGKPDTLKHHEMRHTGEKPHGCEICGKRFIQLVALRNHLKVHNKAPDHAPTKMESGIETSLIST